MAVAGVLSVIRNMATPFGANDPVRPNISATIWRTVSDLTNKRYYFEHSDMPNVVWVDMDKLDLHVGAPAQMFDLEDDFEANGEVSGRFRPAKPIAFQKAGTAVQWKPPPREAQMPVGSERIPAMNQASDMKRNSHEES